MRLRKQMIPVFPSAHHLEIEVDLGRGLYDQGSGVLLLVSLDETQLEVVDDIG